MILSSLPVCVSFPSDPLFQGRVCIPSLKTGCIGMKHVARTSEGYFFSAIMAIKVANKQLVQVGSPISGIVVISSPSSASSRRTINTPSGIGYWHSLSKKWHFVFSSNIGIMIATHHSFMTLFQHFHSYPSYFVAKSVRTQCSDNTLPHNPLRF